MYVDFDYYQEVFGGSLVTSAEFNKYELRARSIMNNHTRKIDKTIKLLDNPLVSDNIKLCMCEMIDNLFRTDELIAKSTQADNAYALGITSESVKDHTVSFDSKSLKSNEIKAQSQNENYNLMKNHLGITGLLYRGLS